MKRETLLGLVVLAALAGGVLWARGRSHRAVPPASGASAAQTRPAAAPPVPDVTVADGAVDLGDVKIVLSAGRPVVAFEKTLFRTRAEANGAVVPLEEGRLSFEMEMPMGDHRYDLAAGADGWREAEVVLPMCGSGKRTWYATVEGHVGGRARTARFRLDLAPPSGAPAPPAAAR